MTRILGIDPGSRTTGFGVVEVRGAARAHVASGCIEGEGGGLPERLRAIFDGVREVVRAHRPEEVAIERVFIHRNVASALKLGEARGVAVLAAELERLAVHEYTAAQVKQSVTGQGRATKEQVQHMVKVLLALAERPPADAADALAVALCHAHISGTTAHLQAALAVSPGGAERPALARAGRRARARRAR